MCVYVSWLCSVFLSTIHFNEKTSSIAEWPLLKACCSSNKIYTEISNTFGYYVQFEVLMAVNLKIVSLLACDAPSVFHHEHGGNRLLQNVGICCAGIIQFHMKAYSPSWQTFLNCYKMCKPKLSIHITFYLIKMSDEISRHAVFINLRWQNKLVMEFNRY
jgi:hypothetical protein